MSIVEFHSAFAKKVRIGSLPKGDFDKLTRRFRSHAASKTWRVLRLTSLHHRAAERLVRRIAPVESLRTLDSLQLAVALNLNEIDPPVTFVCADANLCRIAAAEGLSVINPETP